MFVRSLALSALVLAAPVGSIARADASAQPPAFAGSYVMTSAGGSGVRRMTLKLKADGTVWLKTRFSAKTGRPVAMGDVPPVVETGTWHRTGSRAIVRIAEASGPTNELPPGQRPVFRDLTFALHGCQLTLVDNQAVDPEHGLEFDKDGCVGN